MNRIKKEYKKLRTGLSPAQINFLIEHYRKEWANQEVNLKKHELTAKVKNETIKLAFLLLKILLIGGAAFLALAFPKIFVAFHDSKKTTKLFLRIEDDKIIKAGSSRGYLHYLKISESQYQVELTDKGRQLALKYALSNFTLHQDKKWDGRWRLITFDIKEKWRGIRDVMRDKFKKMGMYPHQKSVFISPYDCEGEIKFWASLYGAENCFSYFLVERLGGGLALHEEEVKQYFNLK